MNKCVTGLLLGVLFFGISSCGVFKKKSRRNVKSTDSVVVVQPPNTNLPPVLSPEKILLAQSLLPLWNQEIAFSTFSGKAKMHYSGDETKQEFTAHFRIKKDNIIWISVTALGGIVQVARLYVTPDSFKLLNYLQREYTTMPLSEANKILPFPADFRMLQNLIVGNVIQKKGTPTDATDFGGTLALQMQDGDLMQLAKWNKADSTLRVLQLRIVQNNALDGNFMFGDYQTISGRKFADTRTVNIINDGTQHYLDMNFGNVDFDKKIDFPFSIPKNFDRK